MGSVPLLFVFQLLACLIFVSGYSALGYNASQLGRLDLPTLDPSALPAHCTSFEDACALESAGNYEAAIAIYESRYPTCGDAGWATEGTAHGLDLVVAFKTSPCGTRMVVKGTRDEVKQGHVSHECGFLKTLSTPENLLACAECFPRYYSFGQVCTKGFSMHVCT